jgi:hypothetical protein
MMAPSTLGQVNPQFAVIGKVRRRSPLAARLDSAARLL